MSKISVSDQRIKARFAKVEVVFEVCSPGEWAWRREKLVEAYKGCLASLLGRQPTEDEVFGRADLRKSYEEVERQKKRARADMHTDREEALCQTG